MTRSRTTRPAMARYSHPGRVDEVITEGAAPAAGKVMVARALRSSSPLLRVIRASHGEVEADTNAADLNDAATGDGSGAYLSLIHI